MNGLSVDNDQFRADSESLRRRLAEAEEAIGRIRIAQERNESALRASESRFRMAVDCATDVVYEWDLGQGLEWFGQIDALTGHSPGGFPRSLDGWLEAIHPDDREGVIAAARAHLAARVPYAVEYRVRAADGSYRWWSARGIAERRPDGTPARWVGAITDVSSRKAREALLADSRQLLLDVTNNSSALIYILDTEGRFLLANDALARVVGVAGEKLLGRTRQVAMPTAVAEQHRANDLQVIREHRPQTFEEENEEPDGKHTYLTLKYPIFNRDGILYAVGGMSTDITERKGAEAALRASETRYRRLHESMRDAFALVDMSGRILESNRSFQEMLGYAAEELTGLSYRDFTPDRWHELEDRIVAEQILPNGDSEVYEKEYIRKDGTVFPVELRTFLLRNESGEPTGMWAIVRDVSARRQLEEQLRAAQKLEAIGRLAGGVAHDFNNALAVILALAERVAKRLAPNDPSSADVGEIADTVERAATLTRQLLAFARRQVIAPRAVDLNCALGSLLAMLKRLLGEDVDLNVVAGQGLWSVRIDPSQVDQILINLATNARDAMPDGGTITITTANVTLAAEQCVARAGLTPGEHVRLSVSDHGVGMDAETRARVFEPFFTTKVEGKGTGLGLASVYGIVTQNAGQIDVASEPGRGTTVAVYLPRARGGQEAPAERRPSRPRGGAETVLLVEDEPALLELVQEALEALGYRVLAAGAALEAISLFEANAAEIQLLVTDVVMPGMGGKDLSERLVGAKPGLRTLFMSGHVADRLAAAGTRTTPLHFIPKPFTGAELAVKVREALED